MWTSIYYYNGSLLNTNLKRITFFIQNVFVNKSISNVTKSDEKFIATFDPFNKIIIVRLIRASVCFGISSVQLCGDFSIMAAG